MTVQQVESRTPDILTAALAWAESGFSIIPIRADGSKAPAVKSWKPYQQERADEDDLRQWFAQGNAGVAVIGGGISRNLEVVDFDDVSVFPAYEKACADNGLGDVLNGSRSTSP